MRINKYIASSGYCSRRKAEELIKNGKVTINGSIVYDLSSIVNELEDIVCIDGKRITIEEEKIYLVLNKPKGYITTSHEQFDRKYIMELIDEKYRVFPVGRLDMDTEGLIILTNDGEFANELAHPRNKVYKTYIAKLDFDVSNEEIIKLRNGVDIGGYITHKAIVNRLKKYVVEVKIAEGKNRQVRKMFKAINKKVIKLKRTAIGGLTLEDIPVGKYKRYSLDELKRKIYKERTEY